MNLDIKREFNEIAYEFNHEYNLVTVSEIVGKVRTYKKRLDANQINELLQIPYNVLENDVELKMSNDEWITKWSNYFAGNVVNCDSDFNKKWKDIFESKNYDLNILKDYFDDILIQLEKNKHIDDFCLRNIEVTLRDDVKLKKYSNFNVSGNVFANEILKVIL